MTAGRLSASTPRLLLCFGFFLSLGVALSWRTLSWPMAYDDLHLIRAFTGEEILASFRGPWDPDRIETPGLRPFTLLFNHLRYALFGEHVAAHRLFLVTLYALFLTLLLPIAARLQLSPVPVIAGAALSLCSRYSVYHYVWLSDGIHLVPALLAAISALLLLAGLETASRCRLVLSAGVLSLGLLTREDAFAVVPVLLVLGCVQSARRGWTSARLLLGYALGVGMLSAAVLGYRALVVPQAAQAGADVAGLLVSVGRMPNLMGAVPFDAVSRALFWGWWLHLGLLLLGLIRLRREARWRIPALWLLCAIVACSPSLTVRRDNLLLLPVTLASLAIAAALWELARLKRVLRPWAAACLAWGLLGGAYVSSVAAENFHPRSARVIWYNGKFIFGPHADKATIPEERRRAVVRQLAALGIRREAQLRLVLRQEVRSAVQQNRRRPGPGEAVFLPLALDEDW